MWQEKTDKKTSMLSENFWPCIQNISSCRVWIKKTNALLNLINHRQDIDKIPSINFQFIKWQEVGQKPFRNPKVFIDVYMRSTIQAGIEKSC